MTTVTSLDSRILSPVLNLVLPECEELTIRQKYSSKSTVVRGTVVRLPALARYFYLLQNAQTCSGAQTVSPSTGTTALFSGAKRPGLKVDQFPPSKCQVGQVKLCPHHLIRIHVVYREKFTYISIL